MAKKQKSSGGLPKELTTVTPLSKTLAVIVFLTVPVIAFSLGMRYQEVLDQANMYDSSTYMMKPEMMHLTPKISPGVTKMMMAK